MSSFHQEKQKLSQSPGKCLLYLTGLNFITGSLLPGPRHTATAESELNCQERRGGRKCEITNRVFYVNPSNKVCASSIHFLLSI